MALDAAIVSAVEAGDSPPTFRIFQWDRPSITIGFAQNEAEVIDLDLCGRDGIPVARRPTGGRAVLHDNEVAFSVIGFRGDALFGNSIADAFEFMGTVITRACGSFGLELSGDAADTTPAPRFGIGKAPCFLTSSRHEVTWRGKKIAGIAQRRYTRVFLQQGSILTGGGHERILRYVPRCGDYEALEKALRNRAVDLATALGRDVDTGALVRGLIMSFAWAAGTEPVPGTVTDKELRVAKCGMDVYSVPVKREVSHEQHNCI